MYQVTNNEFLEVIFSSKENDEYLWVNHHAGDPVEYNENGKSGQFWAGKRIHQFNDCPSDAKNENAYFSVSLLKKQARRIARAKQYASRLPVVVLDDANNVEFTPTYQLETSAGNYQVGLMLDQPIRDVEVGSRLMGELVRQNRVASDKSGNNVVRYARLPCGSNGKYDPPYRHQMIQWNPERTFTLREVCDYLELDFNYITTNAPTRVNNAPITLKNAPIGLGNILASDRAVNDLAMANFSAWVGELFPQAKESGGNYRVSSQSLGRPLQEDISIHVDGIKDFGVADQGDPRLGKRTPIELVAEHQFGDIQQVIPAEKWLREKLSNTTANVQATGKFQIKPMSQAVKELVPPVYVVQYLIQKEHLYTLTAKNNSGKSTFASAMVRSVANGDPFGEMQTFKGRVLLLSGENAADTNLKFRYLMDVEQVDLSNVDVLEMAFELKNGGVERLIGELKHEYVLIVIDSLQAYFGAGDFNSNSDALAHLQACRKLTQIKGNPAVVVLAHPTKSAETLEPYGGGALMNELDSNLTLKLENDIGILHHTKLRQSPFAPRHFQLLVVKVPNFEDNFGKQATTTQFIPLSSEKASGVKTDNERVCFQILGLLLARNLSKGDLSEQIFGDRDEKHTSKIYRLINELRQKKFLKDSGEFELTAKGKTEYKRLQDVFASDLGTQISKFEGLKNVKKQ